MSGYKLKAKGEPMSLILDSMVPCLIITAPRFLLVTGTRPWPVSKDAVEQVHFRVTEYNGADYIGLNLPYSTGLVSSVIIWVKKGTTY